MEPYCTTFGLSTNQTFDLNTYNSNNDICFHPKCEKDIFKTFMRKGKPYVFNVISLFAFNF